MLLENKFDLIISNPPYVINRNLQPELKYEPKEALFGNKINKSGMIYYERIIGLCRGDPCGRPKYDRPLALEIDPSLVDKIKKLLGTNNFEIIKDYNNLRA